jgi:hypothetical protein
LRPYEAKRALLVESRAITDRLRLSDDPYSCQRLRDLKAKFFRLYTLSISEWTFLAPVGLIQSDVRERNAERSGPYWDEMAAIDLYRRHDQLRWCLDAGDDEECPDSGPGRDTFTADKNGLQFQEVDNTIAKRREKYDRPLRERKKAGRKPIGLVAQTSAERMRKYRRNKALSKTLATHERLPAGTLQPLPLGLTVPVDLFTPAQGGDNT